MTSSSSFSVTCKTRKPYLTIESRKVTGPVFVLLGSGASWGLSEDILTWADSCLHLRLPGGAAFQWQSPAVTQHTCGVPAKSLGLNSAQLGLRGNQACPCCQEACQSRGLAQTSHCSRLEMDKGEAKIRPGIERARRSWPAG